MSNEEKNRINAYFRDYYNKNKYKHLLAVKNWQKKNPEKIKQYYEKYSKNPQFIEKRKKYLREWNIKNKDRVREYQKRYRAKKAQESRIEVQSS